MHLSLLHVKCRFKFILLRISTLKEDDYKQLGWIAKRELAKIILNNTMPLTKPYTSGSIRINKFILCNEADVLKCCAVGITLNNGEKLIQPQRKIRGYETIIVTYCLSKNGEFKCSIY
jgi:hypothetical protein